MFTNFTKVIANKVIHKNPRGTLLHGRFLRQSPLDFADVEESTSTIFMTNYRNQRISETLEYCRSLVDNIKPNSRFGELISGYNEKIPQHFRDQTISMIKFYQINVESLAIEPIVNLLYMAAKFETKNEVLETALINRLKEKSVEDATVTNLADLLFYFKSSPLMAQAHREFVDQVMKQAKYLVQTGLMTVKLNGSAVSRYEANTAGAYSTLEEGVIAFLNEKGQNDLKLYLKFKFLLPASNMLLSGISKKLERSAWLYELSQYNELQRLSAFLEDACKQ